MENNQVINLAADGAKVNSREEAYRLPVDAASDEENQDATQLDQTLQPLNGEQEAMICSYPSLGSYKQIQVEVPPLEEEAPVEQEVRAEVTPVEQIQEEAPEEEAPEEEAPAEQAPAAEEPPAEEALVEAQPSKNPSNIKEPVDQDSPDEDLQMSNLSTPDKHRRFVRKEELDSELFRLCQPYLINPNGRTYHYWKLVVAAVSLYGSFFAGYIATHFDRIQDKGLINNQNALLSAFFLVEIVVEALAKLSLKSLRTPKMILINLELLRLLPIQTRWAYLFKATWIQKAFYHLDPQEWRRGLTRIRLRKVIQQEARGPDSDARSILGPSIDQISDAIYLARAAVTVLSLGYFTSLGWYYLCASEEGESFFDQLNIDYLSIPEAQLRVASFTFSTLSTVGLGDLAPQTSPERVCGIILMLMGMMLIACLTTSLNHRFFSEQKQDETNWLISFLEASNEGQALKSEAELRAHLELRAAFNHKLSITSKPYFKNLLPSKQLEIYSALFEDFMGAFSQSFLSKKIPLRRTFLSTPNNQFMPIASDRAQNAGFDQLTMNFLGLLEPVNLPKGPIDLQEGVAYFLTSGSVQSDKPAVNNSERLLKLHRPKLFRIKRKAPIAIGVLGVFFDQCLQEPGPRWFSYQPAGPHQGVIQSYYVRRIRMKKLIRQYEQDRFSSQVIQQLTNNVLIYHSEQFLEPQSVAMEEVQADRKLMEFPQVQRFFRNKEREAQEFLEQTRAGSKDFDDLALFMTQTTRLEEVRKAMSFLQNLPEKPSNLDKLANLDQLLSEAFLLSNGQQSLKGSLDSFPKRRFSDSGESGNSLAAQRFPKIERPEFNQRSRNSFCYTLLDLKDSALLEPIPPDAGSICLFITSEGEEGKLGFRHDLSLPSRIAHFPILKATDFSDISKPKDSNLQWSLALEDQAGLFEIILVKRARVGPDKEYGCLFLDKAAKARMILPTVQSLTNRGESNYYNQEYEFLRVEPMAEQLKDFREGVCSEDFIELIEVPTTLFKKGFVGRQNTMRFEVNHDKYYDEVFVLNLDPESEESGKASYELTIQFPMSVAQGFALALAILKNKQ